jgi:hypothetical protein
MESREWCTKPYYGLVTIVWLFRFSGIQSTITGSNGVTASNKLHQELQPEADPPLAEKPDCN